MASLSSTTAWRTVAVGTVCSRWGKWKVLEASTTACRPESCSPCSAATPSRTPSVIFPRFNVAGRTPAVDVAQGKLAETGAAACGGVRVEHNGECEAGNLHSLFPVPRSNRAAGHGAPITSRPHLVVPATVPNRTLPSEGIASGAAVGVATTGAAMSRGRTGIPLASRVTAPSAVVMAVTAVGQGRSDGAGHVETPGGVRSGPLSQAVAQARTSGRDVGTASIEHAAAWFPSRAGFEGEHPWISWSATTAAKAPRLGYAPSEYRTKQWLDEAQIEGWFPLFAEEQRYCFDADGTIESISAVPIDAPDRRPMGCAAELHGAVRSDDHAIENHSPSWQPDARREHDVVGDNGQARVDISPHRRKSNRTAEVYAWPQSRDSGAGGQRRGSARTGWRKGVTTGNRWLRIFRRVFRACPS